MMLLDINPYETSKPGHKRNLTKEEEAREREFHRVLEWDIRHGILPTDFDPVGKQRFNPKQVVNWALKRGLHVPDPLMPLADNHESVPPKPSSDNPHLSKELRIANEVFDALFGKVTINKKYRGNTYKQAIEKYLKFRHPLLDPHEVERITKLVNPDKTPRKIDGKYFF